MTSSFDEKVKKVQGVDFRKFTDTASLPLFVELHLFTCHAHPVDVPRDSFCSIKSVR